ncbi:hypothetical protein A3J44_02740 [candidate division WOR-1 bacterium RIFCSPHIGHO2_02_FULL_45_12]|nr:MAG: hypothetical protein A3J44_02740 [candidate division WOR-1 bacterium RIFCSPHIGHO2_02_FULL_45_12]
MKKGLILISCLLIGCGAALAVNGVAADPSNTLFTARQLGLGGVSAAFSDDANGVFSNPAGLTNVEFPQLVGASRKLMLDETQYTLFAWAIPSQMGTFGLGYTGANTSGSIPTKLDPASGRIIIDPSSEAIGYGTSVIALSYSKNLRDILSLGATYKLFNQSFSGGLSSQGTATGLDLSALFKPRSWLTIGTNLQNVLEGTLQWSGSTSTDKIGGFYKLGFKLNVLGSSNEAMSTHPQKLDMGFDYNSPHNTPSAANYSLGFEYFPLEKTALRVGYNPRGITYGIGMINGGFRFDYAYAADSEIPGNIPHYFSLSYVGEQAVLVSQKLTKKEPYIVIIQPQDRLITDQETINIIARGATKKYLDEKTIWRVTGLSETQEVNEITQLEELTTVYLNGNKIDQTGTIEVSQKLVPGRNVFQIVGYTPDSAVNSAEVKVLRVEPFNDTAMDHWAIEPISLAVTLGLVKGYPDNLFKSEKGISRAELITLLVRTLSANLETEEPLSSFSDVPDSHWGAKYIAYGADKGLAKGYPDGTYKPNTVLSRAEGITILARYANLAEKTEEKSPFPDLAPDFWANKFILPAIEAGLLEYLKGKDFDPSAPFTRAEACEVLYRTPRIKAMIEQFWTTGVISESQ